MNEKKVSIILKEFADVIGADISECEECTLCILRIIHNKLSDILDLKENEKEYQEQSRLNDIQYISNLNNDMPYNRN
jgi:hypothetical protein